MKRIYLSLLGTLTIGALSAQITLTENSHVPQIGDALDYITDANPNAMVSNDGANQVWDFSSLTTVGSSTATYGSLSNSQDPGSFPTANLVENSGGGETYYSHNSGELSMQGHYLSGITRVVYSDTREFLKFPMTYNDEFNETFAGTVENIAAGMTFDRSGSINIKAAGYGDVILPYKTVTNALKVRLVFNYSDDFMGSTIATYTDTVIAWYNATNRNFIASYSVGYGNGVLMVKQMTYMSQNDIISSTQEFAHQNDHLKIYPNPTNSSFILESTEGVSNISIIDLKGSVLKQINILERKQSIDVSNLPSGMYLVQFQSKGKVETKKLVIQ